MSSASDTESDVDMNEVSEVEFDYEVEIDNQPTEIEYQSTTKLSNQGSTINYSQPRNKVSSKLSDYIIHAVSMRSGMLDHDIDILVDLPKFTNKSSAKTIAKYMIKYGDISESKRGLVLAANAILHFTINQDVNHVCLYDINLQNKQTNKVIKFVIVKEIPQSNQSTSNHYIISQCSSVCNDKDVFSRAVFAVSSHYYSRPLTPFDKPIKIDDLTTAFDCRKKSFDLSQQIRSKSTPKKRARLSENIQSSSKSHSKSMLMNNLLNVVESCTAGCTNEQLLNIINNFPQKWQVLLSSDQTTNQTTNHTTNQTTNPNQTTNHSISNSTDQTTDQTTNQSNKQATDQQLDQTTNQTTDQTTNQTTTNQTTDHSISNSTDRTTDQTTNQTTSLSNSQSVNQSISQSCNQQPTDHSNNQEIKKSHEQSIIQPDNQLNNQPPNHLAIYTTLRELYKIDTLNLDSVQTIESSLSTIMSVLKKLPKKALEWQQALESPESILSIISLPLIYEDLGELGEKFNVETQKLIQTMKTEHEQVAAVRLQMSSTKGGPLAFGEDLSSLMSKLNKLQNLANRKNWFLMNKEICFALKSAQTDEVNIQTYLKKVHQTHEQLIRKLVNIFDQHTTIVTAKTKKM